MQQSRDHATTAQTTTAPAHYAWGWRLVILLSSLWAGLLVGLLLMAR